MQSNQPQAQTCPQPFLDGPLQQAHARLLQGIAQAVMAGETGGKAAMTAALLALELEIGEAALAAAQPQPPTPTPVADEAQTPTPVEGEAPAPPPVADEAPTAPTPVKDEAPAPTPVEDEPPTPTPVEGEAPAPTPVADEPPASTPVEGEGPTPTPVKDEAQTPTPVEGEPPASTPVADEPPASTPVEGEPPAPTPVADEGDAQRAAQALQAASGLCALLDVVRADPVAFAQRCAAAANRFAASGELAAVQGGVCLALVEQGLEMAAARLWSQAATRPLVSRLGQLVRPQPDLTPAQARALTEFAVWLLGGVLPQLELDQPAQEDLNSLAHMRVVGRDSARAPLSQPEAQALVVLATHAAAQLPPASLAALDAQALQRDWSAGAVAGPLQAECLSLLLRDLSVEAAALAHTPWGRLDTPRDIAAFEGILRRLPTATGDVSESQYKLERLAETYANQSETTQALLTVSRKTQGVPGLAQLVQQAVCAQAQLYAQMKPLQRRLDAAENAAYLERRAAQCAPPLTPPTPPSPDRA